MLCVCRTVLAAVAVSCTLSRIHANGQSIQRLDRIKDLMCVLLLSGIQKDDLDASVLNKLQRYNVNIHDLNNNELLRECTTVKSLNKENVIPKTNDKETKNNMDTYTPKDLKNDNIADPFDLNNIGSQKRINNKQIQYTDGQPELQSVLKFWKGIKINNVLKTTETSIKLNNINQEIHELEVINKNTPDISNSNELVFIQRLLANFILKTQNKNALNNVTKKKFDFNTLSNIYLKKNIEINNNDKADISPINIQVEQYSLNNMPSKNAHFQDKSISENNSKSERSGTIPDNFKGILNALQSLKMNSPTISKDSRIENFNPNHKKGLPTLENIYLNDFVKHENIFTTQKVTSTKILEKTLPQNIIKEIAKTVKELVLKDIRKEIFKTTTSYPTTTIHFTTKQDNQIMETSILNKFMDLFGELKSLNHNTLTISSEIGKKSTIKEGLTYPTIPTQNINGMEAMSYYKTMNYHDVNTKKFFDFSPQIHTFRSNIVSKPVIQVPTKSMPITIQTNNMEIPPLGIPINKPENPINENIIVPTLKPYRIGDFKVDHNIIKQSGIGEKYMEKQPQIRTVNSDDSSYYYSNRQNEKAFSLNKEHPNYNMNFNDKITDRHKQSHRSDEIRHSNLPRFHEQLERGTDYYDVPWKDQTDIEDCCNKRNRYTKQMDECCNRKIASRQQMSLSNMKKQPSYDDTHFKNFLKSQQKVTNMLERILASRSRVRSVETV